MAENGTLISNQVLSECVIVYFEDMKKDFQKLKKSCDLFEQEHRDFCLRIGLDIDAFNIRLHPDHPPQEIFRKPNISERDMMVLGKHLSNREKLYLLEQAIHSIADVNVRRIAEAYYLERKNQQEIALEIGCTKSTVSKKLSKAEETMVKSVDRYFDWKYRATGGMYCFWAEECERKYLRHRNAMRGIVRSPGIDVAFKSALKPLMHMNIE